jgi:hypothetical protein
MNPQTYSNDDLKQLENEVASLRTEVAALRTGNGAGNSPMAKRQYVAPLAVSNAEVEKLEKVIENAINDPREGLARVNKQYARPVLEVIAATTGLRFGDSPDLPEVKALDRDQLLALRATSFDEANLHWDATTDTSATQTSSSPAQRPTPKQ